jgi:hypothetical protein
MVTQPERFQPLLFLSSRFSIGAANESTPSVIRHRCDSNVLQAAYTRQRDEDNPSAHLRSVVAEMEHDTLQRLTMRFVYCHCVTDTQW